MQLAHGRMLSADRSQTFERAITSLNTRLSMLDEMIDARNERIAQAEARLTAAESELADIKKNFGVAYGAQDQVISKLRETVDAHRMHIAKVEDRLNEVAAMHNQLQRGSTLGAERFQHTVDAHRMLIQELQQQANKAVDAALGLTDWQKQCEQSIVLLQGEVDKRDKAIVSCVEEIRAIREQQAMALAGVANLPARGFARGKQT
jgi:chromosome segregation ATPase